jgi:hypothetical protein
MWVISEEKMHLTGHSYALALSLCAVVIVAAVARGQTATFAVDPAGSSIAVSGTALGTPIQQQGPGSLTTTYQGPLFVQLAPTSINFPGGSAISANNSGNWQPLAGGAAGSAPANYGGKVVQLFVITSLAAVRDAVFDGSTTAPLALSDGNVGTFSSAVDFRATSGSIDYNSPVAGSGTGPVSGDPATNGAASSATYSIVVGTGGSANATLVMPIHFTLTTDLMGLGQGVFNFDGTMTARATARPGDANFDGTVNLLDFNALAANFGATTNTSWLSGDFNFDNRIDLKDFNLLAANFGTSAATAPIPEPSTSALQSAVAASAGMWRRRKQRFET